MASNQRNPVYDSPDAHELSIMELASSASAVPARPVDARSAPGQGELLAQGRAIAGSVRPGASVRPGGDGRRK